jgi:hypothetical protein
MKHCERRRAQAIQSVETIEIAQHRNDAAGAQPGGVFGTASESVQANLAAQEISGAQGDIAAANHQHPDHASRLSCAKLALEHAVSDYHKTE